MSNRKSGGPSSHAAGSASSGVAPDADKQLNDMFTHFEKMGLDRRNKRERCANTLERHANHVGVVIDEVKNLMQQLEGIVTDLEYVRFEMKEVNVRNAVDHATCNQYTVERIKDMARRFEIRPTENKQELCERLIEWIAKEGSKVPPPRSGSPRVTNKK